VPIWHIVEATRVPVVAYRVRQIGQLFPASGLSYVPLGSRACDMLVFITGQTMKIEDYTWTLEERTAPQYNHFVLLGSKGMILAYPTIPMRHPEDYYSEDQALTHAKLAANAPRMYRRLQLVAKRLEILSVDDYAAKHLLEEIRDELQRIEVG
jgi:hypothetical protein